jgi:hypothetical protein
LESYVSIRRETLGKVVRVGFQYVEADRDFLWALFPLFMGMVLMYVPFVVVLVYRVQPRYTGIEKHTSWSMGSSL